MELRYALAVGTPAGHGVGQEVAVGLARAGAAVLVCDPDLAAARRTAQLLAPARTRAWVLQADPAVEADARLVAQRVRDLGGADVVVDLHATTTGLVDLVLADEDARRGPHRSTPVAVLVRTRTQHRRAELVLGPARPAGVATDAASEAARALALLRGL